MEFHNGETEVVIQGGSQVLLSTLIEDLGLTRANGEPFTIDEVATVEFVTPELFTAKEVLQGETVTLTLDPETKETITATIETNHDFVLTSEQPFDADQMILTLTDGEVVGVDVTDDGDPVYTTTIKIFDSSAVIKYVDGKVHHTEGEMISPDPAFNDYYYVLATLKDTSSGTDKYWYDIKPVDLKNLTDSSISVTFDKLKSPDGNEIHVLTNSDNLSNLKTRLIHSGSVSLEADNFTLSNTETTGYSLNTFNSDFSEYYLQNNRGTTIDDNVESAYEFGGNPKGDGISDEIHLRHKDENKQYKVRLRFTPGADAKITPTDNGGNQTSAHYYVLVKVEHQSSTASSYAYMCLDNFNPSDASTVPLGCTMTEDDDGYPCLDIPFTGTGVWRGADGNPRTDMFTGHEKDLDVRIVRCFKDPGSFKPIELLDGGWTVKPNTGEVYESGKDFVNGYKIQYDTRASRGYIGGSYYTEEDGDKVWCIDKITLSSTNATSDYDYTSILGPNMIYGIVAEHLYQPNHLQSNFAVNHYSGHGHDARPDLSGGSAGNIVIGEFNISDGSKRNSVGDVAYDPVWGRLKIGKPLAGDLFVFVDSDSGYQGEGGSVYDNEAQTIVVPSDGKKLSEEIVEPGIEYMKRISAELLSKPNTIGAQINGNTAVVDSTSMPDYATIYVDGDTLVHHEIDDGNGGTTVVNYLAM